MFRFLSDNTDTVGSRTPQGPISGNSYLRDHGIRDVSGQAENLESPMDYDAVFSVVKRSVRKVTGRERAGLGLALSRLPPTLGAFWQVGGNYIVINEALVDEMAKIASSPLEFNSFVYMILTHEYLHSVGYIDEREARIMTEKVSRSTFGNDHPATVMSSRDLWQMYPQLLSVHGGTGSSIRIISKFDSDSLSYFA
ncbi:MAG: hypothetical protein QXN26_00065 [Thermoplasmataceae archaeon]